MSAKTADEPRETGIENAEAHEDTLDHSQEDQRKMWRLRYASLCEKALGRITACLRFLPQEEIDRLLQTMMSNQTSSLRKGPAELIGTKAVPKRLHITELSDDGCLAKAEQASNPMTA